MTTNISVLNRICGFRFLMFTSCSIFISFFAKSCSLTLFHTASGKMCVVCSNCATSARVDSLIMTAATGDGNKLSGSRKGGKFLNELRGPS